MRLSTTTSILSKEDEHPRETAVFRAMKACKSAGFTHVELDLHEQAKEGRPLHLDGWEAWADRVAQTASDLNLTIYQGHSFVFRTRESTDMSLPGRPWYEERIRRSILTAARAGVRWLVMHPADFYADEAYDFDKAKAFNLDYWAPFLDLAVKHDVGIAFENMFWSGKHRRFCSEVEELIDFVQAFSSPHAGICWDTGHAQLSRQDQPAAIRKMGKLLKAMHINDNHGRSKKDEHVIPYFGTVAWTPIMQALKEIDYKGCFSFEVRDPLRALPSALSQKMLDFLFDLGQHMLAL